MELFRSKNTHQVANLPVHTDWILSIAFHITLHLLASGCIDEKMVL